MGKEDFARGARGFVIFGGGGNLGVARLVAATGDLDLDSELLLEEAICCREEVVCEGRSRFIGRGILTSSGSESGTNFRLPLRVQ